MIVFILQGFIGLVLFFGIFVTLRRKIWPMFWVFTLFQIGFLMGIAVPLVLKQLHIDHVIKYVESLPFVYSFQHLLYLAALIIIINVVLKKKQLH